MSRLRLSGTLHDMRKLQDILGKYPLLQRLSYGSSLRYLINEPDSQARFYIAEFSPSHISIEIYSRSTPLALMGDGMLRLLSLASFVGCAYDFDISSIFPYLIDILARDKIEYYLQGTGKAEIHGPEVILSKRIISLNGENLRLKQRCDAMRENILRLAIMLLRVKYRGVCAISDAAAAMGLTEDEMRTVVSRASHMGCKVVWHGKNEFSMT
ncbi:MAG: hypothetical protein M1321_00950 [Candidatus Marsarchaeota archaeon]|jgi:hypothetical protein|nr:hypothetical protein [Candidatus Marsarchaeota archaeon]